MNARRDMVENVIHSALSDPVHAPLNDHNPIDGRCTSCPWPARELPDAELAAYLAAAVDAALGKDS